MEPTPNMQPVEGSNGPVVGIIVVIVVLIVGAFYFFTRINEIQDVPQELPLTNEEMEMTQTSNSDDVDAIEGDLEAENFDDVDAEMEALDAEFGN
jgi:hypothetical protein